jgi:hypothetical protein
LSGHRGNTGRSPSAPPSSSQVHFDISDDDSDGDNDDKPQKVGKTKKKQGEPKIKKEPGEEEPAEPTQKPAELTQKPAKKARKPVEKARKPVEMTAMDIFAARWSKRKGIDPEDMTIEEEFQFATDWAEVLKARN